MLLLTLKLTAFAGMASASSTRKDALRPGAAPPSTAFAPYVSGMQRATEGRLTSSDCFSEDTVMITAPISPWSSTSLSRRPPACLGMLPIEIKILIVDLVDQMDEEASEDPDWTGPLPLCAFRVNREFEELIVPRIYEVRCASSLVFDCSTDLLLHSARQLRRNRLAQVDQALRQVDRAAARTSYPKPAACLRGRPTSRTRL